MQANSLKLINLSLLYLSFNRYSYNYIQLSLSYWFCFFRENWPIRKLTSLPMMWRVTYGTPDGSGHYWPVALIFHTSLQIMGHPWLPGSLGTRQLLHRASQVALVVKNPLAKAGDGRDAGSIPMLGRSSGGGNGTPLQYSCLGDPMDKKRGLQTVRQDWVTEHILLIHNTWRKVEYNIKRSLTSPALLIFLLVISAAVMQSACMSFSCLIPTWKLQGNTIVALWDGILTALPSLVLDLPQFLEEITFIKF